MMSSVLEKVPFVTKKNVHFLSVGGNITDTSAKSHWPVVLWFFVGISLGDLSKYGNVVLMSSIVVVSGYM